MKFTKMHGCGNDYVYVNCFTETVEDPAALAVKVSDRHFGIGSDGLILIKPSEIADCEMDIYNADGSRAAMCGNGIRCVAKYAYDNGIAKSDRIRIATASGVKELELRIEEGQVRFVRVDMGEPVISEDRSLSMGQFTFTFTPVSMGNPHAVLFLDPKRTPGAAVMELPIWEIGPYFEQRAGAPERVNAEFVEVIDEGTLQMRVWERGSGETLACGTGACAAAVAAMNSGRVPADVVLVRLRGGSLVVEWDRGSGHVFMTGPAETVFTGEI